MNNVQWILSNFRISQVDIGNNFKKSPLSILFSCKQRFFPFLIDSYRRNSLKRQPHETESKLEILKYWHFRKVLIETDQWISRGCFTNQVKVKVAKLTYFCHNTKSIGPNLHIFFFLEGSGFSRGHFLLVCFIIISRMGFLFRLILLIECNVVVSPLLFLHKLK